MLTKVNCRANLGLRVLKIISRQHSMWGHENDGELKSHRRRPQEHLRYFKIIFLVVSTCFIQSQVILREMPPSYISSLSNIIKLNFSFWSLLEMFNLGQRKKLFFLQFSGVRGDKSKIISRLNWDIRQIVSGIAKDNAANKSSGHLLGNLLKKVV